MVFQNHSLLPWLTVYENVRLAVDKVSAAKTRKAERHDWTMHNLELVHMAHAKDKRPTEISGGMKQRVGIARALAMEPKVLLLDEPFGALDALTRAHLQDQVMEIHGRLGNTVIMITHDVDEAVLLSDRIVMMTNGPAARIGEVLDGRPAPAAQAARAGRGRDLRARRAGRARVPLRPPRRRSSKRRSEAADGYANASSSSATAWPGCACWRSWCGAPRPLRYHGGRGRAQPAYNRVLLSRCSRARSAPMTCAAAVGWYASTASRC